MRLLAGQLNRTPEELDRTPAIDLVYTVWQLRHRMSQQQHYCTVNQRW